MPHPWAALATRVGGVEALAALCGVDRRTLNRWASGTHRPGDITCSFVNKLAKKEGLRAPFARPRKRNR
jgi:hypothetical protein